MINARQSGQKDAIFKVDLASGAWKSIKRPGENEVDGVLSMISRDGKTVYLFRWTKDDGTQLIARDLETGRQSKLPNGTLSPDGSRIANSHRDGKDVVIDVVPTTGGPKREVCRITGFQEALIQWTPDQRYLILNPSSAKREFLSYMRVPVEGGTPQPIGISSSEDGQIKFPYSFGVIQIHPNGRQLVYTARTAPVGTSNSGSEAWVLENFLPGFKKAK